MVSTDRLDLLHSQLHAVSCCGPRLRDSVRRTIMSHQLAALWVGAAHFEHIAPSQGGGGMIWHRRGGHDTRVNHKGAHATRKNHAGARNTHVHHAQ